MLVISRQFLEAVDYLLAARDPWWWANRDTAYTDAHCVWSCCFTVRLPRRDLSGHALAILRVSSHGDHVAPRTSVRPHVWPSQVITAWAVGHHMDRVHSAIPLEELSEVLSGRGARKVATKKVHTKVLLESVLSRSPEYASSTQKPYRGETAKDHWGVSLRGKVAMGTTPRLRHEDKGPLHHSRTEDSAPIRHRDGRATAHPHLPHSRYPGLVRHNSHTRTTTQHTSGRRGARAGSLRPRAPDGHRLRTVAAPRRQSDARLPLARGQTTGQQAPAPSRRACA